MAKRNYVNSFYSQGIPRLPRKPFEFDEAEILDLENKLGGKFALQKSALISAVHLFANGVALQDLALDRRQILDCLHEISVTARKLALLLRMPQKVPAEYEEMHLEQYRDVLPYIVGQLFWWFDEFEGLEELTDRVEFLATITKSAMAEYTPSEWRQGGAKDYNLKGLLVELLVIAHHRKSAIGSIVVLLFPTQRTIVPL